MVETAYRAREGFAVPGPDGMPRLIRAGSFIAADDPLVRSHAALLEPMSEYVASAGPVSFTAEPMRLPSGVTQEQAIEPQDAHANRRGRRPRGDNMPHVLPPEDPDSPASTFAPFQPTAGVVSDDVVEKGQAAPDSIPASEATEMYAGQTVDTSPGHTGEANVDGEPVEVTDDDIAAMHVGGGWYEVNGERVQGKEAAREALNRQ